MIDGISDPLGDQISTNPQQIGQITRSAAIKQFVLGGKAICTISGKNSRYTWRIVKKDPELDSRYTQPVYFVSMLTGPNNLDDYTYVGLLEDRTGQIRLTKRSRLRDDSPPVVAWNWTMSVVWSGRELPPAVGFYHVGRCGRCGRALTVPSSVESGFGPECAARLQGGE